MNSYRVNVIDGPLPPDLSFGTDTEPHLTTSRELHVVTQELMQREPLFHRPEFGTTRAAFEKMAAPEFWEVGASGRRYSRQFVLDTLEKRYATVLSDTWEIRDFHCALIAAENFLVTYTLAQGSRITRRSTIWRRTADDWQIVFHQGTPCSPE